MGYIKNLKWTVADLLLSRKVKARKSIWPETMYHHYHRKCLPTLNTKAPDFIILDSALDKHLSIGLKKSDVGFFIRKSGQYGLIWEKGLCIPVGNSTNNLAIFQVHIVEEEDTISVKKMIR